MQKLFSILSAALLLSTAAGAQEMSPCALDEIRNKMIANNPSAALDMERYEEKIKLAEKFQASAKSTALGDTIPVVFHIVLTPQQITQLGGIQGITTRASLQIDALNRDYNADNSDSTAIPTIFKPLYGDAKLRFGLAHTNPQGYSSTGFTVDTTTATGYDPMVTGTVGSGYICSDAKYASAGGADGWDATRYLNVWVVNTAPAGTQNGFVAGIAIHPSMTGQIPQAEWGVVIHHFSFGQKRNGLSFFSGLDSGRVLVHEVGHYLGLWHVWGNDNGDCSSDDGISDTPPQGDKTQSYCPAFPLTDACSPSYPGVMYMNYMDYSSQTCQNMFSKGQVSRMKTSITQTYPQLVQNPHLLAYPHSTAVSNVERSTPKFIISPNPAKSVANINVGEHANELKKITVINGVGQVMLSINAEQGRGTYSVDIQNYAAGMYYVQCQYDNKLETQKMIVQ